MRYGNIIMRIGLGLLFIWGGLEKFLVGHLGGVGLHRMAASLRQIGFDSLGEEGTYILAILLAATELIAGICIIANRRTFFAYLYTAFIMLVAIITVYYPRGDWMQSMIHIALFTTLLGLGLGLEAYKYKVTIQS